MLRFSHRNTKVKSTVSLKQNQLVEQLCSLRCLSTACNHQIVKTVKELKIHLTQAHTDKNGEVECIFDGCNFKANVTGTLRSHFSRKHPLQQLHNLKSDIIEQSEQQQVLPEVEYPDIFNDENVPDDESAIGERDDLVDSGDDFEDDEETEDSKELFI